jgi:predicted nucleic acid-binding protein
MSSPRPSHRSAFIGSSAFYALSDRDDANHQAVVAIVGALQRSRWSLATSTYVVAEQHALHLSRPGRAVALQALAAIDRSDIQIVRAGPIDDRAARQILVRYIDKEWSFTDASSFAIMDRLGIHHAFTFDRDFEQYGFSVLTPDSRL